MSLLGAFIVPHPPLIIPEIGKGEEQKVIKTIESYKKVALKIASLKPDTIIISSPHSIMYSDYFHISPGTVAKGDFRRFGAEKVGFRVNYDVEFIERLTSLAEKEEIEAGTIGEKEPALDHGTMIPLYYINQYLKEYKIIRIGISGLPIIDHYKLGKCIARTGEKLGRNIVFVASGDLSHKLKKDGPYGFAPEGVRFDEEVTQAMKEGDFLKLLEFSPDFCEAAAECGLRSFVIMAGALCGKVVKPDFLSYEGTFGVGYAVCGYDIIGDNNDRGFDEIFEQKQKENVKKLQKAEDDYVALARLSLETYIKSGKPIEISKGIPKEMVNKKAGVFVSLKKHGQLRGCIGTIAPVTENVANEIIRNAVSAGVEDPRFSPVKVNELEELVYSVDVLSKAESIKSMDELDVNRYGVIVSSGRRRGLLLPNLEGVNTIEQQVSIAKRKAGIYDNEDIKIERFEVVRHI